MNNEQHDPLLMKHDADGITELDNQLPRWWVWLFWITSIYALVYMLYFHVFHIGKPAAAEYEKEMAAALALHPPKIVTPVELAPSTEAAVVAHGKELFLKNCMVCHRADAGGLIGPNLTDEFWIHGGKFPEIIHTIQEGVPAKGMITWKAILKADDIQSVASYVWTLRGTKPVNPKPPEGVKSSI